MAEVRNMLRSQMVGSNGSGGGDEVTTTINVTKNGAIPVGRDQRAALINAARGAANDRRLTGITHDDIESLVRRNMRSSEADRLVTAFNEARLNIPLTTSDLRDPEVVQAYNYFAQRSAQQQALVEQAQRYAGVRGGIRRLVDNGKRRVVAFAKPSGFNNGGLDGFDVK